VEKLDLRAPSQWIDMDADGGNGNNGNASAANDTSGSGRGGLEGGGGKNGDYADDNGPAEALMPEFRKLDPKPITPKAWTLNKKNPNTKPSTVNLKP